MFRTVLVPLDRSTLAEQALDIAAEIAVRSNASIDFVLAHERAPGMSADDPFDANQRKAESRYLESIVTETECEHRVTTTQAVLVGRADEMIATRAHDVDADLIVMTSHGRTGWTRAWVGSVADGVVRKSSIPVLMLRAVPGTWPRGNIRPVLRRILVPLDGSPIAASVLPHVGRLARSLQASVTLLRVVPPATTLVPAMGNGLMAPIVTDDPDGTAIAVEMAKRDLERSAAELEGEGCAGVEHQVVVEADAAAAIVEYAETNAVDVVAMSTHGRGISRLLIGSVADKVLHATSAAVLLNRPRVASGDVEQARTSRHDEQRSRRVADDRCAHAGPKH